MQNQPARFLTSFRVGAGGGGEGGGGGGGGGAALAPFVVNGVWIPQRNCQVVLKIPHSLWEFDHSE